MHALLKTSDGLSAKNSARSRLVLLVLCVAAGVLFFLREYQQPMPNFSFPSRTQPGTDGGGGGSWGGRGKYSHLRDDKFTVAINAFDRPDALARTIDALLSPDISSLLEIVVVWGDVKTPAPEGYTAPNGVRVRYRKAEADSLNQRFLPDPEYQTAAILMSDDDINFDPPDLEFAFRAWRGLGRDRIVGVSPRCSLRVDQEGQDGGGDGATWKYGFCQGDELDFGYSMVLTNLAFVHVSFLDLYHSDASPMVVMRRFVDEYMNCEDIAMNFAVSSVTKTGPLQVVGREKHKHHPPASSISKKPGHIKARSKCLDTFEEVFGYMPLVYETMRVERGVQVNKQ